MPKSIVIEPEKAFAAGVIHFTDIPVNAYHQTIREELAMYSRDEFLEIWRQMCAIREFETILQQLKTTGAYKGITYNHAGPAHLSIGQEAAAGRHGILVDSRRSHFRIASQSRRDPRESILGHPAVE